MAHVRIPSIATKPLTGLQRLDPVAPDAPLLDRVTLSDRPRQHPRMVMLGLALTPLLALSGSVATPPTLSMLPPAAAVALYHGPAQPPETPLTTLVRHDYGAWDQGHKGFLSPADISAQMRNPNDTGQTAAAVATLEDIENANHFDLDLTPQMVTRYEKADAAGAYSAWDQTFDNNQAHLAAEQQAGLYLHGMPSLSELSQGQFGDCYFLSALGGLWYRDPQAAAQLIQALPDGSYRVDFPGYQAEKLTLTQSDLAYAATGQPAAQAQIVAEKAEGIIRAHTDVVYSVPHNPFASADNGGAPAYGIMLVTGNQVKTVQTHLFGYSIADMRNDLAASLPQNLVTASTTASLNGVPGNHALAVLNYNRTTDTVTVWNPWGWEPGDANVKQVGNGVFTMSATTFYQAFSQLDFQVPGTYGHIDPIQTAVTDLTIVSPGQP